MSWHCKCAIATIDKDDENACGETFCCAACPKKNSCEYCCEYVNDDPAFEAKSCPEAVELNGELEVFQQERAVTLATITPILVSMKKLDAQKKQLSEQLLAAMEKYGIKKYENALLSVIYIAETTRNTVDTKALKEQYPDIAKELTKTSKVKASVKVTLKGDK